MRLVQISLIIIISSSFVVHYNNAFAAPGSKSSSKSHKVSTRSKGKKHVSKHTNSGNVWERIRFGLRIPRPSPAPAGYGQIPPLVHKAVSVSQATPDSIKPTGTTRPQNEIPAEFTVADKSHELLKNQSQLLEKFRIRHVLSPKKDGQLTSEANPEKKYTELGRLKLLPKHPAGHLSENTTQSVPGEGLPLEKGERLFKSGSVQRIRTRLGLHPELFKQGDVTVAETGITSPGSNQKTDSNISNKQQLAIRNCGDLKKQDVISLAQQGVLTESYTQMADQCRAKQNAKYERVNKHIAGYSRGFLHQVSERARPYLFHIVDALSKYNLPLDLALLPIVESAYKSTALSPKSAAGIWQFIPSTGREYGLAQNDSYDTRLDVTASTQAAIRFLSGLNNHYKGDWLLALAAYNSGQGTVDAAISRNQAEGLDTDFWSLDLPAETQDYVPRLLALSSIFANPGNYGLQLRPVKNEPYFIKVNIDRKADIDHVVNKDLQAIAKLANFDPEEFDALNAAYLKTTLTERKPFSFLMPIRNANQLHQSLAFLAQSSKQYDSLMLSTVESALPNLISQSKIQMPLLGIALQEERSWMLPKDKINFNVNPKMPLTKDSVHSNNDYWAVHYLDNGETLKDVAERHGVSEGKIREFNKLKRKNSTVLGQRLLIPFPETADAATKNTRLSVLYKDVPNSFNPFLFLL